MREAVWDRAAPRYDDEIFDTIANDRNQVVRGTLDRLISARHTVCDFGCGVGRTVKLLAQHARQVWATDFSTASLAIARRDCASLDDVRFLKRDLARKGRRFRHADVGLLMQVLIMADGEVRNAILASVRRNLKPGGHLVAVVPSMEVTLLTYRRIIQWQHRDGARYLVAVAEAAASADEEIFRSRTASSRSMVRPPSTISGKS